MNDSAHGASHRAAEDPESLDFNLAWIKGSGPLNEWLKAHLVSFPMPLLYQVEHLVDRFRPRPLPIVHDGGVDNWGCHKAVQPESIPIANEVELHAVGGIFGGEEDRRSSADVVVPADNRVEIARLKLWKERDEKISRGDVDCQIEIRCHQPLGDDICVMKDGEPHSSIPQQVERLSGERWTSGCDAFP
jgi:hypothetical protein